MEGVAAEAVDRKRRILAQQLLSLCRRFESEQQQQVRDRGNNSSTRGACSLAFVSAVSSAECVRPSNSEKTGR